MTFFRCCEAGSAACLGCRSVVVGAGIAVVVGRLQANAPDRIPASYMKGLLEGLIAGVAVLAECGCGEPLCSTWRHGGAGTLKGIGIVLRRGGAPSANEPRRLHAARPGSDASRDASAAIAAAFGQGGDRRTVHRLRRLRLQRDRAGRLGGACTPLRPAPAACAARQNSQARRRTAGACPPTRRPSLARGTVRMPGRFGAALAPARTGDGGRRRRPAAAAAGHTLPLPHARGTAAAVDGLYRGAASLIRRHC